MGCDIHIMLERKSTKSPNQKWLAVWGSDFLYPAAKLTIAGRNYSFFTEVAKVRGDSPTGVHARNLPEDVSELAWQKYMECPTDYHSASYMTPKEFTDAYIRAHKSGGWEMKFREDYAAYDLLGISEDDGAIYRVVFWFDN